MLPRFDWNPRGEGLQRPPVDGAGHPGRLGVADLARHQYHLRLLPAGRKRLLVLLRRPAGWNFPPGCWAPPWVPSCCPSRAHADGSGDNSPASPTGACMTLMLTLPAALALRHPRRAAARHPVPVRRLQPRRRCADTHGALVAHTADPPASSWSRCWRRASTPARTSARRVKIALWSLLATQAMNLAFIGWLRTAGSGSVHRPRFLPERGPVLARPDEERRLPAGPCQALLVARLAVALAALAPSSVSLRAARADWLAMGGAARVLKLSWVVAPASQRICDARGVGIPIKDFRRRAAD